MALLVGLIIAFPVIYFIQGRWPTIVEYLVVVIIIFLAVFFSYSWLWAHFYRPNIEYVDITLNNLRNDLLKNNSPVKNINNNNTNSDINKENSNNRTTRNM